MTSADSTAQPFFSIFDGKDLSLIVPRAASSAIVLLPAPPTPLTLLDAFERLLWWLFAGSAGAATRATVLHAIKEQPRNAQQLSQALLLDYSTIRHHLRVLETNRIVITEGDKYGKVYFLSEAMEQHWTMFEAITEKAGHMKKK